MPLSRSTIGSLAAVVLIVATVLVLGFTSAPGRNVPEPTAALGPDAGSSVDAYLAQARSELESASGTRWALLTPYTELTAEQLADLTGGVRVSAVVFRVPVPRVATPVVITPVSASRAALLRSPQLAAGQVRSPDPSGESAEAVERARRIAQYSQAQLRLDCACVTGALVRADASTLAALARDPQVRAVEPAPADVGVNKLGLRPLFPEQAGASAPQPDDGPVPAA